MTYLKQLSTTIICLSLTLSITSYADSNTRIHGGISIDTGHLSVHINDRAISGRLSSGHSHYKRNIHRKQFHRGSGYITRSHIRPNSNYYSSTFSHNGLRANHRQPLIREAHRQHSPRSGIIRDDRPSKLRQQHFDKRGDHGRRLSDRSRNYRRYQQRY